jgi:hypothetical protein
MNECTKIIPSNFCNHTGSPQYYMCALQCQWLTFVYTYDTFLSAFGPFRDLTGNDLNGLIPFGLLIRSQDGSLTLRLIIHICLCRHIVFQHSC